MCRIIREKAMRVQKRSSEKVKAHIARAGAMCALAEQASLEILSEVVYRRGGGLSGKGWENLARMLLALHIASCCGQ